MNCADSAETEPDVAPIKTYLSRVCASPPLNDEVQGKEETKKRKYAGFTFCVCRRTTQACLYSPRRIGKQRISIFVVGLEIERKNGDFVL